ncbi:alpha/beta hydrolase [Bradyrhizobium diazoefficiens]|nr:alpha/beta hydrolase [Bradyrhizobium diazoefficiens]MBR0964990.1 alpha/beta hydrolase [Bradyrhizobium diazoefficiens]MBR0976457.1 alpha/beta hydrolase [Bradyrhizobium diazoefficiens]MBR1008441.1 alpha/beta hydrolase [Bradyrhizobium diazoefficiens]MBR1014950.1 alpha/beta hydrolase [Bradyrhizobium diazoefficiens]MBR1052157.1 alpha/beta hydrolase [Bradyrhizobium diazoefficiens]
MKIAETTRAPALLDRRRLVLGLSGAAVAVASTAASAKPERDEKTAGSAYPVTYHRTATVDGIKIFYREAGPKDAPVVLLLHGFPTSSHMFRNLIPALADRYHVIAPDYPGYGQSDMPPRTSFNYTFDRFGELVGGLIDQLGVTRYAMYVMDYGAPVGWRLALKNPERISGLIVQNGNAYDEGLKEFWDPIKKYWADGSDASRQALMKLVTLETTKFQYTDGMSDVSRISPDNWVQDQALLDRPGNNEIQMDMFYDYRTNLPLYPAVQAYFRKHNPPTLIVWGKNDFIFPADGAHPYKRDLPQVEFHLVNSGHFLLEDRFDEVTPLIRDFLARKIA